MQLFVGIFVKVNLPRAHIHHNRGGRSGPNQVGNKERQDKARSGNKSAGKSPNVVGSVIFVHLLPPFWWPGADGVSSCPSGESYGIGV